MSTSNLIGKWVRFTVGAGAIAGLALSLAACNTVEGVGKDVKSTGKGIEETADKSKPNT